MTRRMPTSRKSRSKRPGTAPGPADRSASPSGSPSSGAQPAAGPFSASGGIVPSRPVPPLKRRRWLLALAVFLVAAWFVVLVLLALWR
jgi:hypothetical protein